MINIYVLTEDTKLKRELDLYFEKEQNAINPLYSEGEIEDFLTQIHNFSPDIVLVDTKIGNCEFISRQIKSNSESKNTQMIFLLEDNSLSFISIADGLVELPLKENILDCLIQSHYKIKQSVDRLYKNNKELSRSLYQLNVLYNTSSQFAGTLNTKMLYEIMLEAMEKTLSYDISSVLVLNSLKEPVFSLNTIHTPSESLINALKIRSIINYKSILEQNENFDYNSLENIKTDIKIKQERSNRTFSLEVFNYDSLFAPIKVGDDFFGVIELFRQTPFSTEDVNCFQAIAHQVALPLRSAKLYEEISITNKKLEKLEKLKSEFVSIVSHELRTPLTPINNSLEIVLSGQAGEISPDTRNFISMAKRNIQRLSGIIEDLLDLSRIQTGRLDFKYKKVDITPSLELLFKTFSQVALEKDIKMNLDIKENLPEIYADLRRIEQIFSNLVSNSLKFTSAGGYIDVEAKVVESSKIKQESLICPSSVLDGKYLKISVSDSGIGMKEEDIPKIFDKFSQIESSLNRNKGGVGLGLTITKQLIDSHLGAISVISQEKKGSSFFVYLPVLDEKKNMVMDLSQILATSNDVGVIKIACKFAKEISEKLKELKLLQESKSLREYSFEDEYVAFIKNISNSSFCALYRTIFDYVKENYSREYCDIMLKSAHTSDFKKGDELNKIVEILKTNTKKD